MKQILLLFVALFANMAYAQNNVSCTFDISMPMAVTEENYLKADSALCDISMPMAVTEENYLKADSAL